jgi:uncharacterized repeat protein (TIGR03847 family)
MASERLDLGPVRRLEACALGTPGRRTFRLVAASPAGTAWLWLEKEELQVLGIKIEQLLGSWRREATAAAESPAEAPPAAGDPDEKPVLEFKVGQLSMGYEEKSDLFVVLAHAVDADPEGPATCRCEVSRGQLHTLAEQISAVCAAGRPRCPLCGLTLDGPKHPCPRLN